MASLQPLGGDQNLQHHLKTLTTISLSLGLLSTLATSFAFYWFVRMRRSFRHDLIMLLIQSDFIKSLWFVIFPIVDYTHGPIASDSTFCQVSGFFLTIGIEASDVAVLLIALHSAMYIIRPRSGLYPYRWLAFAAYVLFPVLVASLAFVDGRGYDNLGYYCYMRNDRGWPRLDMSWVPRYVLFAVIAVTYVCIYIYVRIRILHYERRDSAVFRQRDQGGESQRPLVNGYRHRLRSASSISSILSTHEASNPPRYTDDATAGSDTITWNYPVFTQPSTSIHHELILEEPDPCSSATPGLEYPPPTIPPPRRSSTALLSSTRSSISKAGEVTEGSKARAKSLTSLRVSSFFVRKGNDGVTAGHSFMSRTMTGSCSDQQPTYNVSHNRDKIRRQLRSLFVYPLVYLIIWIIPFVNHALKYDSSDAPAQPWLLALSIVSLSIQGAVDCALFTTREKPWRHTRGGGFWNSVWSVLEEGGDRAGRSREEMLVDERLARARRAGEMIDEVSSGRETRRKKRHWWDVEELDYDMDHEAEDYWQQSRSGARRRAPC